MPVLSGEAAGRKVREGAGRLHNAICSVLDQIPVSAEGPLALARTLGTHKSLTTKLLLAVRQADPIAVIKQLPRTEGLGIFLRAAKPFVKKDDLLRATSAASDFNTLVKRELGGWEVLDVAISSWLPEARAEAELAAGRYFYNGLRSTLGVSGTVSLDTLIYAPSVDGTTCDVANTTLLLGLRRLRPGAEIPVLEIGRTNPGLPSNGVSLSDGQATEASTLVDGFSSSPLPPFRIVTTGSTRTMVMTGDAFGARSAVDLCFGIADMSARPRYQPESGPPIRYGPTMTVTIPVKTGVFNVFLDDSVFPDSEPELILYRLSIAGVARPGDPDREIDRLETTSTIQFLGRGPNCFRLSEYARYVELLQHMCDRIGCEISRLRGYRLRVQYPLPIAQYCMVFDPPTRDKQD